MGQCRSASAEDAQEFSDVERAIETLIKNFHQYSVQGGKETLTPSELQDLVTQQLPHLMPVPTGPRPRHPDFPGPNPRAKSRGSSVTTSPPSQLSQARLEGAAGGSGTDSGSEAGRSPGRLSRGSRLAVSEPRPRAPRERRQSEQTGPPRAVRQRDGGRLHGAGEGGCGPGGKLLQIRVETQPGQEQDQQGQLPEDAPERAQPHADGHGKPKGC